LADRKQGAGLSSGSSAAVVQLAGKIRNIFNAILMCNQTETMHSILSYFTVE